MSALSHIIALPGFQYHLFFGKERYSLRARVNKDQLIPNLNQF